MAWVVMKVLQGTDDLHNYMIERSMTKTQGWIPGAFSTGGQQAAAFVFGGQNNAGRVYC